MKGRVVAYQGRRPHASLILFNNLKLSCHPFVQNTVSSMCHIHGVYSRQDKGCCLAVFSPVFGGCGEQCLMFWTEVVYTCVYAFELISSMYIKFALTSVGHKRSYWIHRIHLDKPHTSAFGSFSWVLVSAVDQLSCFSAAWTILNWLLCFQ